MVMIFNSEKALKYLLEKGYVFTYRTYTGYNRKLGRNWIVKKRGGKKIADVIVSLATDSMIQPFPTYLQDFVSRSGFNSTAEWIDEIKKLNKPSEKAGLIGEVFCVVIVK